MKNSPPTVFRRYAVNLAGVVGAVIILASLAFSYLAYRNAQDSVVERHALQTQYARDHAASLLGEIERNLRAIAAIPWSAPGLTQEERATEYRRVLSILPALQAISLAAPDGRELMMVSRASPVAVESGSKFDEALILSARGGEPSYSEVRVEPGRTTPYVLLALSDKGSSKQISVATIGLQSLSAELGLLASAPGASTFILDATGSTVAHSNRLKALRIDAVRAENWVRGVTESRLRGDRRGNTVITTDGDRHFVSWQALQNPKWLFFASEPRSSVIAPVIESLLWSLGLLMLGLGSALIVSYWLARKMTRPIVALSKSAREFASGNLDHRIAAGPIAEFQIVAQSFNQMAEEVQSLTTGLERKVEEKTAQLENEFSLRQAQTQEITKLEERARIMRDFHDGVGGHLVGLLGAAKREMITPKQIEQMASDALVDFRIAIDSLSPNETDFVTALAGLRHRLQHRFEAAGLQSEWALAELPEDVSFSRETIFHVQRIVAEAVTNVIKHARATRVRVRSQFDASSRMLLLVVEDDGVGLILTQATAGAPPRPIIGRGLANIDVRATQIGARVTWGEGIGGRGTALHIALPTNPVVNEKTAV